MSGASGPSLATDLLAADHHAQLGPVAGAELGEDVGDVPLHGLAGQEQLGRDFWIR